MEEVAALERLLTLVPHLFYIMQIIYHALVSLLTLIILFFKDAGGGAIVSGEKEQQIIFQVVEGFSIDFEWCHLHVVIRHELEARQSSKRRYVLILFPYGLAQPANLDFASLLRQFGRMHDVLLIDVQRFEQRGGETT